MKRIYFTLFLILGQVANLIAVARMAWAILVGSDKARILAISYDQLANAAFNGSEDETISSRAHRANTKGRRWGCVLCRFLDVFDKDHCAKSMGF
ncbi:MAG: hypothetical protein WKF61_01060 [Luteimonas sp.]